ncbi:MAG: hypothetical protein GYB68_16270, partial [Chloroflexi bacterium]|nr:hypothetical protein [Chloroflexota bacterium]
MAFEWFAFGRPVFLDFSLSLPGALISLLFLGTSVALLLSSLRDFQSFDARRWGLFAGLLILAPLLANVLLLRFGVAGDRSLASLAIFGLVPVALAALWLGRSPALLVGLATGLGWALYDTGRITQPLEVALFAFVVAVLLRQRFDDRIADSLRQPLIALPLAAVTIGWPLTLFGLFATGAGTPLTNLDRALVAVFPVLFTWLGAALIAGGIGQIAKHVGPGLAESLDELEPAPWARRISVRLLYTITPIGAIVILLLVTVVAATSYNVATRLVVE